MMCNKKAMIAAPTIPLTPAIDGASWKENRIVAKHETPESDIRRYIEDPHHAQNEKDHGGFNRSLVCLSGLKTRSFSTYRVFFMTH